MLPISLMRNPSKAKGMCTEITTAFQAFVWYETDGAIYPDNVGMKDGSSRDRDDPSFEAMGYGDREPGEREHLVSTVELPSGTYMIDWTASQYGYTEFPLVQMLAHDGWQREFAPDAELEVTDAQAGVEPQGLEFGGAQSDFEL